VTTPANNAPQPVLEPVDQSVPANYTAPAGIQQGAAGLTAEDAALYELINGRWMQDWGARDYQPDPVRKKVLEQRNALDRYLGQQGFQINIYPNTYEITPVKGRPGDYTLRGFSMGNFIKDIPKGERIATVLTVTFSPNGEITNLTFTMPK
jgi:hypothetical protein